MSARRLAACAIAALAAALACSNDPYPSEDARVAVRYSVLPGPPKTLDPAVSYSALDHQITANVYESLLEYDYLLRPYTLIPGLARAVPVRRDLPGGRVAYRFDLRPGMLYQEDPCFALGGAGRGTREIVAEDVAFELMRIADPAVTSPVGATFAKIVGFEAFAARLQQLRDSRPDFSALRIDRQYAEAGGIEGLRVDPPYGLEVVLAEPYPQILYWFAMPFTTPVAWEAVAFYDGQGGRPFFRDHAVGSGAFRVEEYAKHFRIALARNENWYGIRHPDWHAPGATYPSRGEPQDAGDGLLDPATVGRPLPFLERLEFRIEKEAIASFNKFLQGYYDTSAVLQESFDKVIQEGRLSPEMAARGMQLEKAVGLDVSYIGFNMNDPVVGAPAGERGRRLRAALSLAVDAREFLRIFSNGLGLPAQSPLPPGIFGFDPDYANPYRQPDLDRARELLREAGYPQGLDPTTGQPLHLSFDLGDTSTRGRLRFQYFVDEWSRLGVDVEIAATTYNQFQEKVRKGAYQLFLWGWVADYPDPENFLFLLWGPMSQSSSGGPNTANFSNRRYDALFLEMKNRENDPRRLRIIREMRAILERQCPWIPISHSETYTLYQPWMRNVKPAALSYPQAKYQDVDAAERARLRTAWNRPVVWPAWVLAAAAVVLVAPGVVTYFRERQ
jgi:oligopeptide transport system substrate-binding protein